mgnify:CR=1 FL=1
MKPGDSHTFQLNIENKANGNDEFRLSAPSVPSGWRVVFPNNNIFQVEAGRSVSVPIQITVGDDANDGDSETITISVISEISNQEEQQNFYSCCSCYFQNENQQLFFLVLLFRPFQNLSFF